MIAPPDFDLGWRFLLAQSTDMEVIGVLREAHDRTLNVDLNKSGSANCWSPTSDLITSYVFPWRTCLIAQYNFMDTVGERHTIPYWSGPVTTRTISFAQGRCTIAATDWFERLMHLNIQDVQLQYTMEDAGAIVTDLLAKAIEQDFRLPIRMGTVELTQPRTITYTQGQNIGQAILDLAQLEAGYDWYIDPATRQLNIVAKRGFDRPDIKWTFIGDGKSHASNLSECVETLDGTTVVNDIRPRGKFGYGHYEDPFSQELLGGVFQEEPNLSDVVDQNILDAYAVEETVLRSMPRLTYTLTPKPSTKAGVPKFLREFDLGDITYLTARRDWMEVTDQAERSFGASLAIDDAGSDTITNLQTTAS